MTKGEAKRAKTRSQQVEVGKELGLGLDSEKFRTQRKFVHHSTVNSTPLVLFALAVKGTKIPILGKFIGPQLIIQGH